MVGFVVYCEEDRLEESYNICEDIFISAVELTAIQTAMQHISGQEAERNFILTDTLTACWMLRRALEGDRSNKMATKIVRKAATTGKKIIVNWILAHVGIRGNEKADELVEKGTIDGTPTQYKLQLKDLYRQIGNGWFSTTSTEKGRWYYDIERQVEKDPWYNTVNMTNRNTRTISRIIAGHAYTPE
jgi:ribonuclease HI